jgi:hypothetical protein
LGRDLTAKGPLTLLFGVFSSVGVDFNRLEIEQIDEEL